ncbi:LuxR C-terminal-related transcriptional regulator [Streptomyces sp. x-80]|uniref:LuxR C-terminal-related transcriptional regulator n=1 Tax=Streptomyces sp. x-80 TaxID=2789282 RepID=UPI00397F8E36
MPVPARIRDGLAKRLSGTGPDGRSVLLTAACTRRFTVGLLRCAATAGTVRQLLGGGAADGTGAAPGARLARLSADGDPVSRTVENALAAGVLVADEGGVRLRFAHPLFACALYAGATAAERLDAHARLGAVTADRAERARHLALSGTEPDEGVAAFVTAAAEEIARRGAPDAAAALARLAAARTPARFTGRRCERLLAGAGHAYAAADHELCRELALAAAADADTPGRHVRARILVITAADQALSGLDEVFAEAFAHAGDAPHDRAHLHYLRACKAHIADGDTAVTWAEADRAATQARRGGDRTTEVLALALQAFVGTLLGRTDATEPLVRALALPQDTGPTCHNGPRAIKARLDFFADRLTEASDELDGLLHRAKTADDAEDTVFLLCAAIDVEVRAGRCGRAMAAAREALCRARELGAHLGQACYAAAVAEAAGGDLNRAAALAHESVRVADAERDLIYLPLALCLLGQVRMRAGDAAAAVDCLSRARAIARRRGIVDPVPVPWPSDLAEALIAAGEHERAAAVIDEVRDTTLRLGRTGAAMSLLRAEALLRAGSGDLAGAVSDLREAAERHQSLGLPLEHGRDLLALGAVERRRRHVTAALTCWQDAAAVFERAEARPWLDGARAAMHRFAHVEDAAGGGDATPAVPWRSLTPAEDRVARMAGDGATNREIAARLFLSAKTIESTLTRVYRKLGIRSRAELVGLFRHTADEPRSAPRR